VRAPTVGAVGEAKRGEKAQFTRVNEHFEPVFNSRYRGKWTRAKAAY